MSKATLEEDSDNIIKYFNEQDLVSLLEFDENEIPCVTLDLLNEKHPFVIAETPTNDIHTEFLRSLDIVDGITNHQSLFSGVDDESENEDLDI